MAATVVPLYRPIACVICGKPSARQTHPFCSRRCADIDLNRWLSGSYAIPAVEAGQASGTPDDDEDEK
jgi:endogenous inhibitor of DNA gyrase (YacG/DUF329 family)